MVRGGNETLIRDLGSRNGTRVNSVPVSEQRLEDGDQISIGSSLFVFLDEKRGEESRSNPVVFEDTASIAGLAILLAQSDPLFPLMETETSPTTAQGTVRLRNDLNALLKIATAIGGLRDRETLQWQLLGFVFDVIPAERGSIVFYDAAGEVSSTTAWDRVHGPEHPVPVSQAVLRKVVGERRGLVANRSGGDGTAEANATSLLCAPMVVDERVLGAIYLDSKAPTQQFDGNHLQVLKAIAHIAALALENLEHWEKVRQENITLRAEMDLKHDMVGSGPKIQKVFEFIRRVAPTESTVLIQGESGTGKELIARAIHLNSKRSEQAFVAINSAAITGSLFESELFGHEKGAFTGAVSQKKGKVEMAEDGTLFLDEISELAPELQARLLRVLQEREFERVGGTKSIPLNIRLIAATNKSLSQAVEAGEFRKDLFYRLNVVTVTMPPLRERREDIPELAQYFLQKARSKCKTNAKCISREAMTCLSHYDWPGNVRELENSIERAAVLGASDVIGADDLPDNIIEGAGLSCNSARYHNAVKEFKKQMIQQALQQSNGGYLEAAKSLGLHPNSLLRLMRNLSVKAAAFFAVTSRKS